MVFHLKQDGSIDIRISGNIGDIVNLAVWGLGSKLPNFYQQIYIDLLTILCPCCATANLIPPILNYSLILRKSPNLMIANISGHTVYTPSMMAAVVKPQGWGTFGTTR